MGINLNNLSREELKGLVSRGNRLYHSKFCGGETEVIKRDSWSNGKEELVRRCAADSNTSDMHRYRMSDGTEVYAPLRFADNLRMRLANPGDTNIWGEFLNSRAGAVRYNIDTRKGRKKMLKIVPNCEPFIRLPRDFRYGYLEGEEYKDLPGKERNLSEIKLNVELSEEEVIRHPLWLDVCEGDKNLLKRYARSVFGESRRAGMQFHVPLYDSFTRLYPFFLGTISLDSFVFVDTLDVGFNFLRVFTTS